MPVPVGYLMPVPVGCYFERPRLRPARILFIVHGMLSDVVRFNWGKPPTSGAILNAVVVAPPTSP